MPESTKPAFSAPNSRVQRAMEYLGAVEIEPGRFAWKRFDGWIWGGTDALEHAAFGNHAFAPKPKRMPEGWAP